MFEIKGRNSVSQQIVDDVILAINKGELKAGMSLPKELEMAQKYNVSRNTVREALRVLEAYGLVKTASRTLPQIINNNIEASMRIAAIFSPQNKTYANEVQSLRQIIECGLAQEIINNLNQEHLHYLKQINQEISHTTAVSKLAQLDYDFHNYLISIANHQLIDALYRSLSASMVAILEEGKNLDEGIKAAVDGHNKIIDALEKGDAQVLYNNIKDHFTYSMQNM